MRFVDISQAIYKDTKKKSNVFLIMRFYWALDRWCLFEVSHARKWDGLVIFWTALVDIASLKSREKIVETNTVARKLDASHKEKKDSSPPFLYGMWKDWLVVFLNPIVIRETWDWVECPRWSSFKEILTRIDPEDGMEKNTFNFSFRMERWHFWTNIFVLF